MNTLQYSITCNCGITIIANSEKGIVELLKLHNESGRWHLMWKNYFDITEKTEIEKRIERENNADTRGRNHHKPDSNSRTRGEDR